MINMVMESMNYGSTINSYGMNGAEMGKLWPWND